MSDTSYSSASLPAIPGKANYPTSGKTSDYVLTQADCSGFNTFTNEGATGQVTFTLPSAVAGLSVNFLNKAGQSMVINAASGDNFSVIGSETPSLTGIKSTAAGEKINLTALDSTTWYSTKNTSGWGSTYTSLGCNATKGYSSGGLSPYTAVIDKFNFASSSNATFWGNLSHVIVYTAGQSSAINGYVSGGRDDEATNYSSIQYFSFSSTGNASLWGNLTSVSFPGAGCSSQTLGFQLMSCTPSVSANINSFAFASAGNGSSWGDLTQAPDGPSGFSSLAYGFRAGGYVSSAVTNIDRFSFASSGNATSWANMSVGAQAGHGLSSDIKGFNLMGYTTGNSALIDNFPFASQTNGTNWGSLTSVRQRPAGQSGPANGWSSGGYGATVLGLIEVLSFVTSGNTTTWGTLSANRGYCSGTQG